MMALLRPLANQPIQSIYMSKSWEAIVECDLLVPVCAKHVVGCCGIQGPESRLSNWNASETRGGSGA